MHRLGAGFQRRHRAAARRSGCARAAWNGCTGSARIPCASPSVICSTTRVSSQRSLSRPSGKKRVDRRGIDLLQPVRAANSATGPYPPAPRAPLPEIPDAAYLAHQRQLRGQALRQIPRLALLNDLKTPMHGTRAMRAQLRQGGLRECTAIGFQPLQNLRDATRAERMVDHGPAIGQGKSGQGSGKFGDHGHPVAQSPRRPTRPASRVARNAWQIRHAPHPPPPSAPRSARYTCQGPRAGAAADNSSRHPGTSAIAVSGIANIAFSRRNPVAAMHRNPDAAAHAHTIDQRHIRLAQLRDRQVHRIFRREKRRRPASIAGQHRFTRRAHIPAGAKPALGRIHQHHMHRRVRREIIQCRMDLRAPSADPAHSTPLAGST